MLGKDLQVTKPKVSSSFAANEIQSEQIPPFRIVNASLRSGLAPYAPLKGSTPWRASNNVATVYLCLCSVVEHNIRRCHEAVPNPGAASTCRARTAHRTPPSSPTLNYRLSPDMRLENKIMLRGRRRQRAVKTQVSAQKKRQK